MNPSKFNAAARIYSVLSKSGQHQPTERTAAVWPRVFGLEDMKPAGAQDREVARILSLLYGQVAQVRKELESKALDMEIHEASLRSVEKALAVRNLGAKWSTIRNNFTEPVPRSLLIWSDLLEAEPQLNEGDEERISSEVERLRDLVQTSALPEYFKTFLGGQVNRIEQALRDYPYVGLTAFSDAARQSAMDLLDNRGTVAEHRTAEATREVLGFWSRYDVIVERVLKTTKLAGLLLGMVAGPILLSPSEPLVLPPAADSMEAPDATGLTSSETNTQIQTEGFDRRHTKKSE